MGDLGFEFVVVPYVEPADVSDALALVPPLPEAADVAAEGYDAFAPDYGVVDDALALEAQAENEVFAQAPEWMDAIVGPDGDGGCLRATDDELAAVMGYEARNQWAALAPSLTSLLNPYVSGEPTLVAAKEDWASCMSVRGFSYPGPFEAQVEFEAREELTADEVETAQADLSCRLESGFRDTFLKVTADGVAAWRLENEAAISELVSTTEREVSRIVDFAEAQSD